MRPCATQKSLVHAFTSLRVADAQLPFASNVTHPRVYEVGKSASATSAAARTIKPSTLEYSAKILIHHGKRFSGAGRLAILVRGLLVAERDCGFVSMM